MAYYRQNLRKIGEEAFWLIDQQAEEKQRFLYHPTKPFVHHPQPPQVSNVHRADPLPARSTQPPLGQNGYRVQMNPAPVVDRDEHGGLMDCYEAARRYGGIVVTDYYPKGRKIVMKRNNKAYQW